MRAPRLCGQILLEAGAQAEVNAARIRLAQTASILIGLTVLMWRFAEVSIPADVFGTLWRAETISCPADAAH
jgi:hypothetical protein